MRDSIGKYASKGIILNGYSLFLFRFIGMAKLQPGTRGG